MPIPPWAIMLIEKFGIIALQYAQRNWKWGEKTITIEEDTKSECRIVCKPKE